MASVELTRAAIDDLEELMRVLTLPEDTRHRVGRSLAALERLPLLGPPLAGRWEGMRFLLGPWRWMLLVYTYDEADDRVVVLTIQDARSSRAPTAHR